MKLPPLQRAALDLLRRCAGREDRESALAAIRAKLDDGWAVVTSGSSAVYDGQAWINWRTAEALERGGLVEVDRSLGRGGYRLKLTAKGLAGVAARRHDEARR